MAIDNERFSTVDELLDCNADEMELVRLEQELDELLRHVDDGSESKMEFSFASACGFGFSAVVSVIVGVIYDNVAIILLGIVGLVVTVGIYYAVKSENDAEDVARAEVLDRLEFVQAQLAGLRSTK